MVPTLRRAHPSQGRSASRRDKGRQGLAERAWRRADCRAGGDPWVSAPRPSHFLLHAQEKVTKEKGTPTSGSARCAARLPSLRRCSGGRHRRAIPGPTMPCAAVLAAYPLRNTCARPSVRGLGTELPERCLGQPLVDKAMPLSTLRVLRSRRVDGRSHPPITPKLRCPYSGGLRASQTRSVCHCIPTRSVGTISFGNSYMVQAIRCSSPLQEAERRWCAGGERQGRRERHSWARESPSMPASGAVPERGTSGRHAARPGGRGGLRVW